MIRVHPRDPRSSFSPGAICLPFSGGDLAFVVWDAAQPGLVR
jgi:hypothetical protein